jgi:hypothetical protein
MNDKSSNTIAIFDTAYFDLVCNYFNEWFYDVADVLKDDSFRTFYIGSSLDDDRKQSAYKEAAKHYNTLVPETERIPLF